MKAAQRPARSIKDLDQKVWCSFRRGDTLASRVDSNGSRTLKSQMQRLRLSQSFVVVISALLFLSHISAGYVVNSAGYWPQSKDVEPISASNSEEYAPVQEEEEPSYTLCPSHPSCWQNVFKYPAMAAAILQAIQNGQVVQQRQSRSLGSEQRRFHSAFDRFSKKSRFGTVRLTRK